MFYIPIKFKSYLEKVEKKQHNEIYFKIYCNEAFLQGIIPVNSNLKTLFAFSLYLNTLSQISH